mgnify:CR=1 FL=1
MAAKPAAKPAAAAAPAAGADAPKKGFPIVLVAVVLLAGLGVGGGAAIFMLPKPAAEAEAIEAGQPERKPVDRGTPAQYVALEPAFVVNLADEGSTRYLQTEVQLSSRDPQVIADIGTHSPAIRNALLMLFAKKTQAELRSIEGREQLQKDALAEVNRVLKDETGYDGVDALFFTSFVTQ